MPSIDPVLEPVARRILIVVEDATLAEILGEALSDAGHTCHLADGEAALAAALKLRVYDTAIVDVDTRARDGLRLLTQLQLDAPMTTRIALLPCGGAPFQEGSPAYHFAVEKPARLEAVLRAIHVSPTIAAN
jgi:CheY-like chemotaxis protein